MVIKHEHLHWHHDDVFLSHQNIPLVLNWGALHDSYSRIGFLKVNDYFQIKLNSIVMGTLNKWGHSWRKKYQWGNEFIVNGNCTYATDFMVFQDQDDAIPLELHVQRNCRCLDSGSTLFDVGAICLVEDEIGPSGYKEPKLLQNFKLEVEVMLPPGEKMWPALWLYSTSGSEYTDEYKYLEFDIFEGWSGPNANYKVKTRPKNGCQSLVDEEDSYLVQSIHGIRRSYRWGGFKRKVYTNLRNEFEIQNPTSEYHKFTFARVSNNIAITCDDEIIISVGKSNKHFKHLKDPVYLIIANGVCCNKPIGDTSNSILFIRNLSLVEYD